MTELDSKAVKIFWATRRVLVMAVALGLAGLVLISAVVIPQFQESMDLYNDLQKEKPKLEKLELKLAELESIEVSPEYARIETVERSLPSKKPLLELLMALNSVSQRTGTVVKDFELTPGLVASDSTLLETTSKSAYDELKLDMTVAGTFEQIQDFLLKVEEVSPFTTIVSMEIGSQLNTNAAQFASQVAADPIFEAELTTETYFYTQSIQSRIDSPLPKIADRELEVLNFLAEFVPTELQEQTEIRGGGLEDLFQISPETGLIETTPGSGLAPLATPVPTAIPESSPAQEVSSE